MASVTALRLPRGRLRARARARPRSFDNLKESAHHFSNALTTHARNYQRRLLGRARKPRHLAFYFGGTHCVSFVERDQFGFLCEAVTVGGKLRPYGFIGRSRIARCPVNEMQQHATALNMTEETIA